MPNTGIADSILPTFFHEKNNIQNAEMTTESIQYQATT